MKQKIYLPFFAGISLLSLPLMSLADTATIQSGAFIGLGADFIDTLYGYKDVPSSGTSVSITKDSSAAGFRPDIYGGYAALVSSNNLYFGFDVGAQLGNSKTTEVSYYNTTSSTNNASQGMTYYADLLPGFVLGEQSSVLYGIIGAAHSNFKFNHTDNNAFSQSEGHFGYRIGLGYTLALSNSFSVDARFAFSDFGGVHYVNGTDEYQLNPKNLQLSLGINYTFDGSAASRQSPFLGD